MACEIDFEEPPGLPRISLHHAALHALGGVYFLWSDGGELLYVGQSGNIAARMAQHAKDPRKAAVASVSYVREEELDRRLELETIYVVHFRPPLNKAVLIRVSKGRLSEIRYRRGRA